jgi:cell wall-associated NlpC family hydrolase
VKRLLAVVAILGGLTGLSTVLPAEAAHAATTVYFGNKVLNEAETRAGDWYVYGTAGPATFDCSGLVVWSAAQLGKTVPRTTFSMLADSGHFYAVPVSSARRGDLMFYGSGHVEIMTSWYHTTFGAQETGTRVGWHRWSAGWAPTMALRWRG